MITRCVNPGCDAATKRPKEGGWTWLAVCKKLVRITALSPYLNIGITLKYPLRRQSATVGRSGGGCAT
jgi:hypothetical protein